MQNHYMLLYYSNIHIYYGIKAYYPINNEENSRLYQRYKALADAEKDVIFGGRLAEYKYYDMAPVIESAMKRWMSEK